MLRCDAHMKELLIELFSVASGAAAFVFLCYRKNNASWIEGWVMEERMDGWRGRDGPSSNRTGYRVVLT